MHLTDLIKALSSDIWSIYKVFLWLIICNSEEIAAVEILTVFIFSEMHRDKMRDIRHKQHKASYKWGRSFTFMVNSTVGFWKGQWDFYSWRYSELMWATDLSCPCAEQRLDLTELHRNLPSCIILYLHANNIQYFSGRDHSAIMLRLSCLIWKPLCNKDHASYQAM